MAGPEEASGDGQAAGVALGAVRPPTWGPPLSVHGSVEASGVLA